MIKHLFVILALLLIAGCSLGGEVLKDETQTVTENVSVEDIETDMGDIDSLMADLDMSELDSLEAELNSLSLE